AEHVAKVIKPALAEGQIVVCDRHADSTVAFQGYGRRLDMKLIQELNRIATAGISPDLTVLLDVDPKLARTRLSSRPEKGPAGEARDRLDDEHDDFHARVREGYLALASLEPARIRVVDSSGPFEEVRKKVLEIATAVIESKRSE
ncbi:MAG: dTMP kinase, partial [Blastocatellia bacterium]